MKTSKLVERIRVRLGVGAPPPVSPERLRQAESTLGFALPDILRQLYRQVANGRFGPGHGLLEIGNGSTKPGLDMIELYSSLCREADFLWPDKMLPITNVKDGTYACVDCSSTRHRMNYFEPELESFGLPPWVPLALDLAGWLSSWLDCLDIEELIADSAGPH